MPNFARSFLSAVGARIKTFTTVVLVVIAAIVLLLYGDAAVRAFYWAATKVGMTPSAALTLVSRAPLISFITVIGLILVSIFLLAWADVRKLAGVPPPTSPDPALPIPTLPPTSGGVRTVKLVGSSPPRIEFVTCEAQVALVRVNQFEYSRLPGKGDITYGAVAAFRHRGGDMTSLTAHLLMGGVHVHSVAWVGCDSSSISISTSQTAELILAVHSHYGYHYVLDRTASGLTHKSVPYGSYVAEVELDIRYAPSQKFKFDLSLTPFREGMKIALHQDT